MEADLEGKQRTLGVCGLAVAFQKDPISCSALVSLPIVLELSSTTLPPLSHFLLIGNLSLQKKWICMN
ncbi:uncharacterized [Tachysurus ichikawai]